jgi:hypothetical protein
MELIHLEFLYRGRQVFGLLRVKIDFGRDIVKIVVAGGLLEPLKWDGTGSDTASRYGFM